MIKQHLIYLMLTYKCEFAMFDETRKDTQIPYRHFDIDLQEYDVNIQN